MIAERIVDVLLDEADPDFVRRFVRSVFGVRLIGLDIWGRHTVSDAMLYGDGRFQLLNDNRHIPFKTTGFYMFDPDTGTATGSFHKISSLGKMYDRLEGKAIRVRVVPTIPGTQWRDGFTYEGIVKLELG